MLEKIKKNIYLYNLSVVFFPFVSMIKMFHNITVVCTVIKEEREMSQWCQPLYVFSYN